jgi:hypothetical protein
VRINYWLIKSVVTHGARCVRRQNGTTLSHVFCDTVLYCGAAQNISTRQHFSITLRPVVQRYQKFVTHITHNSILPFKFRVEGFWSSSPETSSSRLPLRSLYTLIGDILTHVILLWTLLTTPTLGQHCLHAIANSINVNVLVKRTPLRESNTGSKHRLTPTETLFINNIDNSLINLPLVTPTVGNRLSSRLHLT